MWNNSNQITGQCKQYTVHKTYLRNLEDIWVTVTCCDLIISVRPNKYKFITQYTYEKYFIVVPASYRDHCGKSIRPVEMF